MSPYEPMRIKLSDERKKKIVAQLIELYTAEFDRELSEFQAERVLEFFMKTLGAPVYNQAIQDARSFMNEKLEDLAGDFYEEEKGNP